jgi:hypothetical protein
VISLLLLLVAVLAGVALVQRFLPDLAPMLRLGAGLFVGIILTAWITFITAFGLSYATDESVFIAIFVALAVDAAILGRFWRLLSRQDFRFSWGEMLFIAGSLLFSFWLMDRRLRGDPLMVSANTWGDMGLHASLARSFSWGTNFPPEYPFFGDEPIRYHLGYDFFAGVLNRGGLSVLWSFNLPGALGFTAMMLTVFELGRLVFGKWAVGFVAVILLVTNSSFAFLEYFEHYDWNIGDWLNGLWDYNQGYKAVGPYFVDGEVDKVSIFWTLNVFLTQTHLIVAMAGALFIAYVLMKDLRSGKPLTSERALFLGAIFGLSFWLNGVIFIAATVLFLGLFYVYGPWRQNLQLAGALVAGLVLLVIGGSVVDPVLYKAALVWTLGSLALLGRIRESWAFLAPAAVIALPQAVWLNGGLNTGGDSLQFHTGYLVGGFNFQEPGSYWDFIEYWFLNLGLTLPLLVLAALLIGRKDKKLMLAVMGVFIFGNFVQLSRDLGGHNHKVFNFWEILMNVFAAYAFVRLFDLIPRNINLGSFTLPRRYANGLLAVAIAPAVMLFLVLSGVIDFMVIKNDPMYEVFGRPEAIQWVDDNTEGDAMFLTNYGDLYTTPALAGRRIYLGYEPWVGSAGYDLDPRRQTTSLIYSAASKEVACGLLLQHNLDYVQLGPQERGGANAGRFQLNEGMWTSSFTPVYSAEFPDGTLYYYDVAESCASGTAVATAGS